MIVTYKAIQLHVLKPEQTNPFPFITYSEDDLSDTNRRRSIFTFYLERQNQSRCYIYDDVTGERVLLSQEHCR